MSGSFRITHERTNVQKKTKPNDIPWAPGLLSGNGQRFVRSQKVFQRNSFNSICNKMVQKPKKQK